MESSNDNFTFEYSFSSGCDRPASTLKAPINLQELQPKNVDEFCARLVNFHNIPCFVEADLVSSMKKFVSKETERLNNENSTSNIQMIRSNPHLISEIAKTLAAKYQKTCKQFATSLDNKTNDFPQAYHYLIHSTAMSVILKLETKYRSELTKLISTKEQCEVKMQERQQLEMARMCENVGFAYTNHDVTVLASKHLADAERLTSQLDSDYSSTIQHQKDEFLQVVLDLHQEMKENDDKLSDSGPAYNKIKRIIDENVSLSRSNFQSSQESFSPPPSNNVTSQTSSSGIFMEESFTINLGAQLKTMHNVRLLVTDILNFCRYFDEREAEAQRFQSAMSLYSNSLSAVVIFSDKRLGYKTGIQKEFAKICQSSTEFHFDSLSDQLISIKNVAEKYEKTNSDRQDEGYLHLNEGDFYVTKHSNLSQVHVVFHVIADESHLQTKASLSNISSRHPIINGLRQILKVCSSYNIGTLTIPLLLTHELTEEITFQWCVKRAELIMKCVKGFMMEMTTWDGGVSRTIQFVVPPGISEEVFDCMRSTLPEVFRTTSTRDLTRSRSFK